MLGWAEVSQTAWLAALEGVTGDGATGVAFADFGGTAAAGANETRRSGVCSKGRERFRMLGALASVGLAVLVAGVCLVDGAMDGVAACVGAAFGWLGPGGAGGDTLGGAKCNARGWGGDMLPGGSASAG